MRTLQDALNTVRAARAAIQQGYLKPDDAMQDILVLAATLEAVSPQFSHHVFEVERSKDWLKEPTEAQYDAAWSAFGATEFEDLHPKLSIDHIRRLFKMFAWAMISSVQGAKK